MEQHQSSPMRNPWSFQELLWPPRFYRCSFCRRGFRSSQALGGHMNVHRRDGAKLKQQYSPTSPPDHQSSHLQNDSSVLFRDINCFRGLQMLPSFVSAGDHETRKPLFKDRESSDETIVGCERIRKSDRNLPCLRRELFTNCNKVSGSIEDAVDVELRLGSKPPSLR